MYRNIPLALLLLVATSSCQINRLHHFHVKEPVGEITVTTSLGAADLPLRFPSPTTIHYGDMNRGEIRINEVRAGEATPKPLDFPLSTFEKSMEAAATFISGEIANEFALSFKPGFVITLLHYAPGERVAISGTSPLSQGIFAGVPLEDGGDAADALGILITALAHEYSELLLAHPDTLHCSLYANTQSNRWAGEGVAEFVTSLCESKLRKAGFEINPIENLLVPITISSAAASSHLNFSWQPFGASWPIAEKPALLPTTINLSQWTFDSPHESLTANGVSRSRLRYLAAEYVVSLWYHGAQLQGMEKPISELTKWISFRSPGPTQTSLIQWMEMTSGVEISSKVVAVSTADVLGYHRNKAFER